MEQQARNDVGLPDLNGYQYTPTRMIGENGIPYKVCLKRVAGSTNGAIFLAQIIYWWGRMGEAPFYKFFRPNDHPSYKKGDSWTEELYMSYDEIQTALSKFAKKITKGISKSQARENYPVIYWTDSDRTTWFEITPLLDSLLGDPQLLGKWENSTPLRGSETHRILEEENDDFSLLQRLPETTTKTREEKNFSKDEIPKDEKNSLPFREDQEHRPDIELSREERVEEIKPEPEPACEKNHNLSSASQNEEVPHQATPEEIELFNAWKDRSLSEQLKAIGDKIIPEWWMDNCVLAIRADPWEVIDYYAAKKAKKKARTADEYKKDIKAAMDRGIKQQMEGGNAQVDVSRYPPDVQDAIKAFCHLWHASLPKSPSIKSYWIIGARQLEEVSGEFGAKAVLAAYRKDFEAYMEKHGGLAPITVSSPKSLVNNIAAKASEMRGQANAYANGRQVMMEF